MKQIATHPGRAELAYQALLDGICDGSLQPGMQLVQEELAVQLGVSRHPIQQALARLKADGLLQNSAGRGLCVSPLDLSRMRAHYEIRNALDCLAAGLAATRVANQDVDLKKVRRSAEAIIKRGRKAVVDNTVKDMIRHDIDFHSYLYEISGNALIASTAESHWRFLRRVMGDVLRKAERPPSIWEQHQDILDAVLAGDPVIAQQLAGRHIELASERLTQALGSTEDDTSAAEDTALAKEG